MDKTLITIGIIAIVAILAVTLILNPFGGTSPDDSKTSSTPESKEVTDDSLDNTPHSDSSDTTKTHPPNDIDYETAVYGKMLEDVAGDCMLYQHMGTDKFQCFGTAGNYSTMVTNEYRAADSDSYFCKNTIYGCKLYQKVDFQ